jgi:CRISPR/Cas system-associated protein Cas5 (RAMP superfamily)
LQLLLDFFGVEKSTVKLLIHRPPAAETRAVREAVEHKFKVEFKDYLFEIYKNEEEVTKTIDFLFEKINPLYAKGQNSYNSLFLFDDYTTAYNYIIEFSKPLLKTLTINDRVFPERCFSLLLNFYKIFLKNVAAFI